MKKKLPVRWETVHVLTSIKGGEDMELPPTLLCDPLKAERIEAPE